MARDILSEYGRDSSSPKRPRATSGGVMPVHDVMGYCPPQGPTNIGGRGPGLHGDNHGMARCPVASGGESGSPGLHGDNQGVDPSENDAA